MYQGEFYDLGDDELVMTLEIEGENRCEILNNILNEEWNQSGHFIIEGYELDEIFFHLLIGEMNPDSDLDLYDSEYQEYLFKVKTACEMGLDLSPFLGEYNKEVNSIDIFNFFCESIRLKFEYDNDTLNIDYKIKRI